MFKAFLKKVEETTKAIENATTKPLDSLLTQITPPIPETIKNFTAPKIVPIPESLKKTLDIDSAIQVLSSSGPPAQFYKENIDLHPGTVLLHQYVDQLNQIHANHIVLARKAEAADRRLPYVVQKCNTQYDAWRKLNNELVRLPELTATVTSMRTQVDVMFGKLEELEVLLDTQVEAYYASELSKFKEKLTSDNTKLQSQKQKDLASLEEELATSRARFERDTRINKEREESRQKRIELDQQRRKKEEDERERRKKEEEDNKQRRIDAEQQRRKKEEEDKARRKKEEEDSKLKQQQQQQQQKENGGAERDKDKDTASTVQKAVPQELEQQQRRKREEEERELRKKEDEELRLRMQEIEQRRRKADEEEKERRRSESGAADTNKGKSKGLLGSIFQKLGAPGAPTATGAATSASGGITSKAEGPAATSTPAVVTASVPFVETPSNAGSEGTVPPISEKVSVNLDSDTSAADSSASAVPDSNGGESNSIAPAAAEISGVAESSASAPERDVVDAEKTDAAEAKGDVPAVEESAI